MNSRRIKPIKTPERMTKTELLEEVKRLGRGLQGSSREWCPICGDWYTDYEYSPGCENHDMGELGLASDARYDNKIGKLGYRWPDAEARRD